MLNFLHRLFTNNPSTASLVAIYLTEKAGQPMQLVRKAHALNDAGLEGDRYCTNKGYWHRVEACQVTLISEHDLKIASKGKGNKFNFDNGCHRRNLLISGIKTKQLIGKTFRIGDAIFRYAKPRPPCGYLDKIEGQGMALALSYNSGVCLHVIKSGDLTVGDCLEILET